MGNPIKILLVSPFKGTVGGISKWTGHILKYYNSISIKDEIDLDQFYVTGKSVHGDTSKVNRLLVGIIKYIPFLTELKQRLKASEYNVVHFTSSASISLIRDYFAIKIARKYGVKTIIHFRFGRIPELQIRSNWEWRMIKKVITLSDKTIVIDSTSFSTLTQSGFKNIEFLPNPITPEVSEIIYNSPQIERKDRLVLFVGHVIRAKGVFELIKACKGIPNIKLRIFGHVTNEMRNSLNDLAGKNNNWLDIVGEKSFEDTIKEILSCELFVLPSYTEGFPNVILESMACGCSIIATKVGAIPEMLDIDGKKPCGLCIEPKNVFQLRSSILKLLDDEILAFELGKRAKRRVNEEYSMPVVWSKMVDIWKSVL